MAIETIIERESDEQRPSGGGGGGDAGGGVGSELPIGTLYTNMINPDNPATYLGYGVWEPKNGVVIVGYDPDQTEFDTAGETGGNKETTLTTENLPSHTHQVDPPNTSTTTDGDHTHYIGNTYSLGANGSGGNNRGLIGAGSNIYWGAISTNGGGNHSHTVNIPAFTSGATGSGEAFSNLMPYEVGYMWVRTA